MELSSYQVIAFLYVVYTSASTVESIAHSPSAYARAWPVTTGLVFAILAVFQWQRSTLVSQRSMNDYAVNSRLIRRNEWRRLFIGQLMHVDVIHIAYNLTSALIVGPRFERWARSSTAASCSKMELFDMFVSLGLGSAYLNGGVDSFGLSAVLFAMSASSGSSLGDLIFDAIIPLICVDNADNVSHVMGIAVGLVRSKLPASYVTAWHAVHMTALMVLLTKSSRSTLRSRIIPRDAEADATVQREPNDPHMAETLRNQCAAAFDRRASKARRANTR